MKSNRVLSGIAAAVIFAMYNLIVFMFTGNFTVNFWISYGFTVLAFVIIAAGGFILTQSRHTVQNEFYNAPAVVVGLAYFLVQLAAGIVLMVLNTIDFRITIVVQSVILGLYILFALISAMIKNSLVKADANKSKNIIFSDYMKSRLEVLCDKCDDSAIKQQLNRLEKTVSNGYPSNGKPMSLSEQKIAAKTNELETIIGDAEQAESVNEKISEIFNMLEDRNKRCRRA